MSLTPLSNVLLGWRGAGGDGASGIASYFFFGGLLAILGGVGEVHDTYPLIVSHLTMYSGFSATHSLPLSSPALVPDTLTRKMQGKANSARCILAYIRRHPPAIL